MVKITEEWMAWIEKEGSGRGMVWIEKQEGEELKRKEGEEKWYKLKRKEGKEEWSEEEGRRRGRILESEGPPLFN